MFKITIAIPHYNDIFGLGKTLASIRPQVTGEVQVLISDNATGATFSEWLENERKRFPNLVAFINDTNIGYDENVDACVRRSRGEFVWFLGAGDTLSDGALASMLNVLCGLEACLNVVTDIHVVSAVDANVQGHRPRELSERPYQSYEVKAVDRIFNPALSGNVINRYYWNEVMGQKTLLNDWVHIERVLQMHAEFHNAASTVCLPFISVNVLRPREGWWNKDNNTSLLNTLKFYEIIDHYSGLPEFQDRKIQDGRFSRTKNLLRAALASQSVDIPALPSDIAASELLLRRYLVVNLVYRVCRMLPHKVVSRFYSLLRRIAYCLRLVSAQFTR